MKRRILICMAVMLLSLLMCGNLWAESSGSCGDNITWTLDDDDNLTLTGSGQMADYNETYEHPWSDNVKTVKFAGDITGIGSSAFRGCRSLTSIEIPNSVTSIGKYAFDGCISLKKVYITDLSAWCRITFNFYLANPLSYGGALYLNGKEVKDLVIPDDVTKIGQRAFSGCSSLSSVSIPNSVTSIGDSAFSGCTSLTSIEIPNSVTSIGNSAFNGCSSLTKQEIPNSVTSIGEEAFYNCSSLTSIEIPNSVTNIGNNAFGSCSNLKKVYITDLSAWCRITFNSLSANPLFNGGVLYLNGKEVKDLVIPDDVTKIGEFALSGCSSLSSVSIPNSVTSIGISAFLGCSSLTSIEIPNSVTSIGNFAFKDCSSLASVSIGNSVTSIGERAFYNCSSLTSVTIGNSVTSIGDATFYNCSSLTSVTIGNSVTSIGQYAFFNCNSLKKITVNATTPPDCGYYIFEGVDYSSCVLVVPDESISAYKNKSPWNQFLNISEVESVINDNEVSVKVENGNIVVTGIADDVNMEVYNISGSRIYSGIVKSVQVPTAGLYLVKVLDKSYKIMVR